MTARKTKSEKTEKASELSRAPRKKTQIKTSVTQAENSQPKMSSSLKNLQSFKIKRTYLIGGLILILLAGLAVYFRSIFVVAMVNGQPVSRLAYIKEMEKMSGKQALDSLITKTIILQEARKKNVSINPQEVDQEIKKIEENLSKQGQKLDTILQLQGMTRESLREQVYFQKLIEKMVGQDIKVSDQEVNDYIKANRSTLPQDAKEEDLKKQVREQLRQQKLNEKVQTWIKNLQEKAKVTYLIAR
jgi:parvulin-like peptidyl-prolyl isomerase